MTFTQQQKKTAYISLNPSVQYFITDPESREISEKISKQYSLDFDQTDNLDEEIDNTILGLQSFREMIINLRQKLGLSDDKIIELARDLKQQIFDKLDEIKKGEIQYQIPETFISTPTQLKAKINPPTTYNSQPTTYKEPNQTNTKQNALERMDGVFNKTAPAPGNLPSQPTTDNIQQIIDNLINLYKNHPWRGNWSKIQML